LLEKPTKREDQIELIMSKPTIIQVFLKKLTLKPFGPGALLSSRKKKKSMIETDSLDSDRK
jgi:hypothetical protein